MADTRCNQVLRATQQVEIVRGPGFRLGIMHNGTARATVGQWPILSIQQVKVADAAVLPYQWRTVATGAWAVEKPPLLVGSTSVANDAGTGDQAIIVGPGYVKHGTGSTVMQITYTAGWPHAGIAAAAAAGDEILHVDDCTGWAPVAPGEPGAGGVIQDTIGIQEAVTCLASSVTTGPGILTLAAPLAYAHSPGVLVSAMPGQIQWATILYAASMALTRGSTATTVQSTSGRGQSSASGAKALQDQAAQLLGPFRRLI